MWTTRDSREGRASTSLAAAILLLLATAGLARGQEAPIIVYFADGSNAPLNGWSFSYEYEARGKDAPPSFGSTSTRESRDLLSGKKSLATAGAVLEVQYREYEEARQVEGGETRSVKVATATGFVLTVDGKARDVKIEAPHVDLLAPQGVEKGVVVKGLGIDLQGTTLTGARRSFCLAGYVYNVQCHPEAADRVMKVEFPR
jgi:hypothetical protein